MMSHGLLPVCQPVPDRKITELAFLKRFTGDEDRAIEEASRADTELGAALRRNLSLVKAASVIDLALVDPTRNGVLALEAVGLIGTGRAAQILDGPITDDERP